MSFYHIITEGGSASIEVLDEGMSLTSLLTSLDFVGGGVTATNSGGDVEVSIPGGSGAGLQETPTGTVNGSNTTFTPSGEPDRVISDGVTYFDGDGYTWNGSTIEMDVPPSQYIRAYV